MNDTFETQMRQEWEAIEREAQGDSVSQQDGLMAGDSEDGSTGQDAVALPAPNPLALVFQHLKIVEAGFAKKTFEERMKLGRRMYANLIAAARKAFYTAAYFGALLRLQFDSKTEEEKEAISQAIMGRGLSTARRYLKLIDHLDTVVARAEGDGLDAEELGLTKLLEYVPKQEGKGGRPKKKEKPDAATDPVVIKLNPNPNGGAKKGVADEPHGEAGGDRDADGDADERVASGSPANEEEVEYEVTLTIVGKLIATASTINQVVADLDNGDAVLFKQSMPVVKNKKTIAMFKITNVSRGESA